MKSEFKNNAFSLLKKVLVEIFKLVFNDSLNDFLNKGFSNPSNLAKFFIDPDSELKKEIENEVNEKYKKVIESDLYVKELKPFYDSTIANFSIYKKDIEDEAIKEKNFTENNFIEEKKKKKLK